MTWWQRFIPRKHWWWSVNTAYIVPFRLYSVDGKRSAEVRLHRNGLAYFVEQEWVEGTTFKNRDDSRELGPYYTLAEAEGAATSSLWFTNGKQK